MGPFSSESLRSIVEAFNKSELIQVRGLSRNAPQGISQAAERLTLEVSMESGTEVRIVEIKGHAASLYQAFADESGILLRTTGKANQWVKRSKPLRDERGQIVKDS